MNKILVRLDEVADKIKDADCLLYRKGRDVSGDLIAVAGRSIYRHAAMAAHWGDDLFSLEMLAWSGGSASYLPSEVCIFPGAIDVYAIDREPENFSRDAAVVNMRRLLGTRYAWRHIAAISALHLPVIRWFSRPNMDDLDGDDLDCGEQRAAICSEAYSRCLRWAGIDPVPELSDAETEPGDLARSAWLSYRFTLTP